MEKKLLLVVDAQKDFVYGALRNEEAIKRLPNLCNRIRNWKGLILFTQDTHHENYLETQEGKNLDIPHCIEGTDGWEICDEVKEAYKEIYGDMTLPTILKKSFGYDGWAEAQLDKLGITEIEVDGFCTDICVISQVLVLKAMYPEIKIVVKEDCCAGLNEKKHQAALEIFNSCQVEVI